MTVKAGQSHPLPPPEGVPHARPDPTHGSVETTAQIKAQALSVEAGWLRTALFLLAFAPRSCSVTSSSSHLAEGSAAVVPQSRAAMFEIRKFCTVQTVPGECLASSAGRAVPGARDSTEQACWHSPSRF